MNGDRKFYMEYLSRMYPTLPMHSQTQSSREYIVDQMRTTAMTITETRMGFMTSSNRDHLFKVYNGLYQHKHQPGA